MAQQKKGASSSSKATAKKPDPRKGKTKRQNSATVVKRRKEVAALYLKGFRQVEIGEKTGYSQTTISNDLAALRKTWAASGLFDYNTAIAEELARLDKAEQAIWAAYEAVRAKPFKEMKEEGVNHNGPYQKTQVVEMADPGTVEYMREIRAIVDKRTEILGYKAAMKIEHTSKGESLKVDLSVLSADELEQYLALELKLAKAKADNPGNE